MNFIVSQAMSSQNYTTGQGKAALLIILLIEDTRCSWIIYCLHGKPMLVEPVFTSQISNRNIYPIKIKLWWRTKEAILILFNTILFACQFNTQGGSLYIIESNSNIYPIKIQPIKKSNYNKRWAQTSRSILGPQQPEHKTQ